MLISSRALVLLCMFVPCFFAGGCQSDTDPLAHAPRLHERNLEREDDSDPEDQPVTTPPSVSACDPAFGPVAPVGTSDILYPEVASQPCFEDPCSAQGCESVPSAGVCGADAPAPALVERLLACDAIGIGWDDGLGSSFLRVRGRQDGHCLIDITTELEGGVQAYSCALPLPMSAWAGLTGVRSGSFSNPVAGIEGLCTTTHCNLFPEAGAPCNEGLHFCH